LKKILFLAFLFLAPLAHAERAGSLGLGVMVGDPFGPTLKYWLTNQQAFDVGVGFANDPVFYADYIWHNFQLIPPINGAKIGAYIGVGPRFESRRHEDDAFGFRVPLGLNFLLSRAPIEFFAEIVPVFQVSPDTDGDFDGGIGLRVYFGGDRGRQVNR
jgi:hypothetical protein